MRTFIAVDPPEEVKTRIHEFVRPFRQSYSRGIAWSSSRDLHVSLKFLGEVEDSRIPLVEQAVRSAAAAAAAFPVAVAGTGSFPPFSRHPRVLWIGLEESRALEDLQARLEEALEARGFPREARPFHPHLTAARIKSSGVPPPLIGRWAEAEGKPFGRMEVREIIVYRSLLRPGGAEHQPVFSEALRP